MIRAIIVLIFWLASGFGAYAQSDVKVIGTVTPGNCVQWFSPTQIKDPGVTCNGGAGSSPGGSNLQIQYNNSGTFGGLTDAQVTARLNGLTTHDVFLGSGRPWCDVRAQGAVGDGSTDDDTAFTACLTVLSAFSPPGGIIYVPPGVYCLTNGTFNAAVAVATTVSITIQGAGPGGFATGAGSSTLDVCGADIDLLTLSAQYSSIKDIRLNGAVFTTNPAHNSITLNCQFCIASHILSVGGYYSLFVPSTSLGDYVVEDSDIRNGYGVGAAWMELQGSGGYIKRVKNDVSSVCASNPTPWTATTSVTLGQCVTTQSFIIQYNGNGTTGGSPPTLLKYGQIFTDGTTTANLRAPTGVFGMEVVGGLVYSTGLDASGPFNKGIRVGTSGALFSTGDNVTDTINGSVVVDGGYASFVNGNYGGCVAANCPVFRVTTAGTNIGLTIGSGMQIQGGITGVEYDGGSFLQVTGARFSGLTTGINIGTANLNNISIIGNMFGFNSSAVTSSIIFQNGTSDFVNIMGNSFAATTTPFTGTITGTHNRNETLAVSCTLTTVSHLTVVNGIVTLCN